MTLPAAIRDIAREDARRGAIVVHSRDLWSERTLAYGSGLVGLVTSTLYAVGSAAVLALFDPGWASDMMLLGCLSLVFVVPALLFHRYRVHLLDLRNAWVAGMTYGIGLGTILAVILGFLMIAEDQSVLLPLLMLPLLILGVLFAVLSVPLWVYVRKWAAPVHIQDGTLCPGCAYSLIGNESMVCPECGRPFTVEELGTTEETFFAQLRAGEDDGGHGSPYDVRK
jgi:hypothetical protein